MPKTPPRASRGRSDRLNVQEAPPTGFRCPHCPFQGCNKRSLNLHLGHHTAKFSSQCTFCTYSVQHSQHLARHIKRVHPVEPVKPAAMKYKARKQQAVPVPDLGSTQEPQPPVEAEDLHNEGGHQAELEKHVNQMPRFEMGVTIETEMADENPLNEAQIENTVADEIMNGAIETEAEAETTQNKEAQLEKAVAVPGEIVEGAIGTEESDDDVMVLEHHHPNPWCHKCSKPIDDEQALLINCSICEKWFHCSCVGGDLQSLEVQWMCSVCVNKESPMSHLTKLIKAVNSFSEVYHGGQVSANPSTSSANSDDARGEDAETTRCRDELAQLESTIRSSWTELDLATKKVKDDARLMRASRAIQLRKEMEELNIVDHGLSFQLAVLLESKTRDQKKEADLWELKMTTEEKLSQLRKTSFLKVKEEVFGGPSSSLEKTEGSIQRCGSLLDQLKGELAVLEVEVGSLNQRIQETEVKVSENKKKLVAIRSELEKLRGDSGLDPSSPAVARIKSLKSELQLRVKRFYVLLARLVQLNARLILGDIQEKEKEWSDICFSDEI